METSEERSKRFREQRENIAAQLLEKYPEVTFNRHKFGIDIIHYAVQFHDKVCVCQLRRGMPNTMPNLDSYFLSEQAARNAIEPHIPAAREKFKECLKALNNLKRIMGFDVSYIVEGDTHGVTDYPYIDFNLEGFSFTFRIDD